MLRLRKIGYVDCPIGFPENLPSIEVNIFVDSFRPSNLSAVYCQYDNIGEKVSMAVYRMQVLFDLRYFG